MLALGNPNGQQSSFAMKTEIIKGMAESLERFTQQLPSCSSGDNNAIISPFPPFYTVLTYMINDMTKFVHQYHDQIFPCVWQLLTQMADIYVKVVVNGSETHQFGSTDEDDELNNFNTLIIQMYEFIHSIVEHMRFKPVLKSVITDLVYISIVYMQITEDQINIWDDDSEAFTDDFNDLEVGEFSIRSTSTQLLLSLADEFGPEIILPAFSEALKRHLQVAIAEKNASNAEWWKVNEAAISAFGVIKKFFSPANPAAHSLFNAREYLLLVRSMLGASENVSGYQNDVSPYLHNRALWTLCAYSDIAPDIYDRPQLQAILDTVANNMSNQMPMIVQIVAIKALQELCLNLKKTVDQRKMVSEKLPVFLAFITDIGARGKGSVLYDLLTAISVVVMVNVGNILKIIYLITINSLLTVFFSQISFLFLYPFSSIKNSPLQITSASFRLRSLFSCVAIKIRLSWRVFKRS